MSIVPYPWPRSAYGVDDDGGVLRVIQATRLGKRTRFTSVPVPPLASSHPAYPVAACLLQRESFTKWLTTPLPSRRQALAVFRSLLDIQLPFPVEECETAVIAVRSTPSGSGTRGLLAGARHTDIARRVETLAARDLDPAILDPEGLALWTRSLEEIPRSVPEADRVVLYAGTDRSTLVLGQGGEYLMAHAMREANEETIARLIKSASPALSAGSDWILCGPRAGDLPIRSLHAALAARFGGTALVAEAPAMFLARALAARAVAAPEGLCNLRSGPFTQPDVARRAARRPLVRLAMLMAAGIALCLTSLIWTLATRSHLHALQQSLSQNAARLAGTRSLPQGQDTLTLRRILDQREHDLEPMLAAADAPLPTLLGLILESASRSQVTLETVTLTLAGGTIQGHAAQAPGVETFARRLQEAGWTTTLDRKENPPGETGLAFVMGLGRRHDGT